MMIQIELWSDFSCPFCYIGKARLERVIYDLKIKNHVHVTYKAYQLNPFAPTTTNDNAYVLFAKKMGITMEQAKEKFSHVIHLGKEESLTMDYATIQMTNTFDAHRLAKYASTLGKDQQLTTRLMKAYFSEGKNLSDLNTLLTLAIELGLDELDTQRVLSSTMYEEEVQQELQHAKSIGVRGVPFFVLNDRYAISGAQSYDHFKDVLRKLMKEEHIEIIEEKSNQCQDDVCELNEEKK
jgi:predicted DsbA family dithiol-disulfide isomerase